MPDYTPILKLVLPEFDQDPWDEDVNNNFAVLDAAYGKFISIEGLTGVWLNSKLYNAGQVAIDGIDSSLWTCAATHTSAEPPTTFAQERAANPSYWTGSGALVVYLPITGGTLTGNLDISGANGTARYVRGLTGPHPRWAVVMGDIIAEASNSGSNFAIYRYNDAGALVDAPISIGRLNGNIALNSTTVNGALNATQVIASQSVSAPSFLVAATGGAVYGDATHAYYIQDSAGWRWQYERATGTMHWIAGGSNIILFSIDGSGNVIAKGTITASGSPVLTEARIAALEARVAALEAMV